MIMPADKGSVFMKTLTILFVEDDPDAMAQLSQFLKRRVGTLITAANGAEGLSAFKKRKPDIVITDIQMPEMDGLTMSLEIRRLDSDVPIIVVTAFEQTDYLVRAIEIGLDKYIPKPVDPERLHAALVQCAEGLYAENRFRLAARVLESSREGIVISNADQHIVSVNRAFTDITGYSAAEAIGQNPVALLSSGRHDEAFYGKMTEEIRAKGCWQGELWNRRKNDQVYPEWLSITTLTDANGDISHYIGVFSDISERRQMEEQLRQSQKMEAIGQLAGGVAHDFNNILMVIIGYCDMLRYRLDADAPERLDLEQISTAANRATTLISGLLAFSRKQIMNPRKIDLNRTISDAGKFLRRIIGEDIQFKTAFEEKSLPVFADGGQIAQMLMNLATNARDAVTSGGLLSIETSLKELDEHFIHSHGYGSPGKYAQITVSDNGTGMDEKTRQRIFEPFFTTKESGKGTGLGMAIVYGIVKQHNGYINVYSEPGVGTTFRIYLPVIGADAVSNENIAAGAMPPQGSGTILIAEDDPAVREMEAAMLRNFGYDVILAADGLDAVRKFSENRSRIQLVIMDMIMPGLNGKQAFDEMRKLQPDARAIFVSGYSADIVRSRGEIDENAELVMKPVQTAELLEKIRNTLNKPQ